MRFLGGHCSAPTSETVVFWCTFALGSPKRYQPSGTVSFVAIAPVLTGWPRLSRARTVRMAHVLCQKRDNIVALMRIESYGLERGAYWQERPFSVASTLNRKEQEW